MAREDENIFDISYLDLAASGIVKQGLDRFLPEFPMDWTLIASGNTLLLRARYYEPEDGNGTGNPCLRNRGRILYCLQKMEIVGGDYDSVAKASDDPNTIVCVGFRNSRIDIFKLKNGTIYRTAKFFIFHDRMD